MGGGTAFKKVIAHLLMQLWRHAPYLQFAFVYLLIYLGLHEAPTGGACLLKNHKCECSLLTSCV